VRRRTGLTSRAQSALAQQLEMAAAQRQESDIQFILSALRDRPQLILCTRAFVEAGGLEPVVRDTFPRGVRKISDVPIRDKARAIAVVANISEELLKGVSDYEVNIPKLFYWMVGLPRTYAVIHRVRKDFFESLRRTTWLLGSPSLIFVWKLLAPHSTGPTTMAPSAS